jgi:hypothetical protein
MKKLLITTGIALLTLTSCSKEPLMSQADCDKALQELQVKVNQSRVNTAKLILEYSDKYPSCNLNYRVDVAQCRDASDYYEGRLDSFIKVLKARTDLTPAENDKMLRDFIDANRKAAREAFPSCIGNLMFEF